MPARVVAPTSVNGCRSSFTRARSRAFADHDVDLVILQRRIQDFLHHRRQAMDFIDEQHIVGFQIGQHRRQVAGALQHRAGSLAQIDAHLARDDVRQRGLAQARRAEQQRVVERLAAVARGGDEDFQLAADLFLADVFVQLLGAQRALDRLFVGEAGVAAMMRCSVKLSVWMLMCMYASLPTLCFGQGFQRQLDAVGHAAAGRHAASAPACASLSE